MKGGVVPSTCLGAYLSVHRNASILMGNTEEGVFIGFDMVDIIFDLGSRVFGSLVGSYMYTLCKILYYDYNTTTACYHCVLL